MPAKRKPQPAGAQPVPARPVGRPTVPGLDRRKSRSISLPESLWDRLDHIAAASASSVSTIAQQLLTTKTHV